MINVALVEPEIPPNTGNIARLCAATKVPLHIVGKPGFRLDDRSLKRAGLDYWPHVQLITHRNIAGLYSSLPHVRFLYLTTKTTRSYIDWIFDADDCLVFGNETRGLPQKLLDANHQHCLTIPILNSHVRSLNLATAAGIVLYEALRQTGVLKQFSEDNLAMDTRQ